MPIADEAIQEHGEKCMLVVNGDQTIDALTTQFKASGYKEDRTWVIVALPDEQYGVIRLTKLGGLLSKIGDLGLTLPLAQWPIPPATVIPQDTPDSTGEILESVASTPGARLVITQGGRVVGLFVNPTMGGEAGLVDALSYLELHGELAKIKDRQTSTVPKPQCPHCGYNQDFYNYDIAKKELTCKKCSKVTGQL